MDEKYIPYSVDGRSYKIPESKSAEFEKTYPEATIRMSAEDRVYNIPFSKKNEFMSTYPEATYAFKMEEPKEDAHDVTLGETIKYSVGNIGTTLAKGIWDWAVQDMSRGVYKDETGKVERNKDYDSMIRDNDYPIQISKKLGAKSEEFARKADPTGGDKDYIDLISEGKVGTLLQKSIGDAIQSLPATVAAGSPVLIVPYVLMNAASNYADQSINNPEIPKWKRGTYALASAVFEQAVERFENPFKGKAAKELTEDAAKKILNEGVSGGFKKVANRIVDVLKRIGKGAKGEAIEEGVTSFGNDAIGQALDWIDGNSDYGFTAQWEDLKKENPDANMMDFALGKTREYINAAIGGGLSGVHMSGPSQIVHEIGSLRSENRGREVVDAARAMGETWGYADIYNANEEVANATAKASQVFVDESGNQTLGEDFIGSLSSEEAFNLSQKAEITDIQSAALLGLSIAKAQQEGMVDNINNGVNKYVSKQREIINSVTENDNVVIGLYNNTPVYVMGGVVNNGSVTLPNGEAGPVFVVDMNTGEKTAARSEDISSAMSENALDFSNQKIGKFLEDEKRLREEAKNTVSPAAKLRDVQQYSGKKILLNGENGTYEVLVQQVLPDGKVIVKGKKGDLGGQSIVTMDAAAFYDSIYRDGEGKPVITNAPAEETIEETEEVVDETPEAVVTGEEDYREQVVPIVINGKVVNVEVTGQDNTADRITYEYTDENGNVKSGSSTIGAFKTAAEQAATHQPVVEAETEPTINDTVEETPIEEAPVEEITPEAIDWDALFEQDKDAYLAELKKQYGDETLDILNEEIEAAQNELDALGKAKTTSQNERLANRKKKAALQERINALTKMVESLTVTAEPEVAETAPEAEVTPEPTVEPEPVVEETPVEEAPAEEAPVAEIPVEESQPEPMAEAPHHVDNPITEAKRREAELLKLLGKNGISNELKKDAARRAGKEVADMFATREEYEQYEADAADLGEFIEFFDEGVNDSFANRNQQTNTGESQGISVPLESEPKEEENGTETETAEGEDTIRQGDDTVGGRTVDGGTETADTGNQGTEQELGESESESGEQVKKEYPARKGNATRQTLVDTFGFAKVSIPNTESTVLNTVYDFMMAMSKMLGVSPNVIGNGGWLDVANLRSNANASAAYNWKNRSDGTVVEPRLKLKYGRVSSIAHEWWHSLDHVIKFFNTGKGRQTATYNTGALEAFGVRKEVKEALEAVLKSMKDSGFEARISAMSLPLQYKFYLLENEEMTARAFDAYINDKFEAAGIEVENAVYERTPYQPTPEEMAVIAPAFDNLFKVLKEKEGLRKGTSVLYQIGNILEKGSEAWKAATDAAITMLEDAGLAPIRVTDQQVEEMLKSKAKVDWLKTDNGTVYGWTDGKNIYLTEAGMNPNTPIHEYTHLWAKAMMKKNPKGWESIKSLLKNTPVWDEVMKDQNYSDIHNDEDAVASEVLSRISGSENALKLEQMAQQMIDEAKGTMRKLEAQGIIQRIKDALNEFWNWVGTELFKIEEFDSVEQITDRVLWDLINKTDLGELRAGKTELQIAGKRGAYNLDIEEELGEGVAYRMNALELAEQLESEGFDKKLIRTATGWERGYDGKWRFEIDDLIIKDNIKLKKGMTLGDIAEKNELFKAYPFLADIEVRKMTTKEVMETDADGAYIENDNTIIVKINDSDGFIDIDAWEVLVHEVQHAIQHYEGFTTGASESFVRRNAREILREEEKKANPLHDRMEDRERQLADEMREEVYAQLPKRMSKRDKEIALRKAVDKAKFNDAVFESLRHQWLPYAKRIQTLKVLTGDPFYRNRLEDPMVIWDLYKSYAGEVEARNAVNRMYLMGDERAEKTLEETEDTPRERQIAVGESSGISEARKKSYGLHNKYGQKDNYTQLFLDDIYHRVLSKYHFGKASSPYVYMDGYLMQIDVPNTENLKYYRNVDKTDGFGIRYGKFVGNLTEEEFNNLIDRYEQGIQRTTRAFSELLETYRKDRSGTINSDNVNLENVGPDSDNDGLYTQTQRESARRGTFVEGGSIYLRASEIDSDISPISRVVIPQATQASTKLDVDEYDEIIENEKLSVVLDPETASRETTKEVYDRVVKGSWQEFQRQFQDAYQPVRIAIEAIQQETGNMPIQDYENYLLIQNQSSSRSRVETDNFVRKYYKPIIKHLEKLIDKIAKRDGMDAKDKETRAVIYSDIIKYLIAKHGLERNKYYQEHRTRNLTASEQNKEIKAAKDAYDTEVANITTDSSLTDAERELKLREAFDAYEAAVTEIKTRQVPDLRDYSGLTSLFGLDSKKWEEAQKEAQTFVDEFENALGRENNEEGVMIKQSEIIEALWNKINAATNKTLRHSYESGMLSRTQYDDIKGMFKFYIPLRGFDETTAEDVYSYSRFEGNRFNPAVKTAKGRTSVADDPIAIIMNMAESEIAQGNKNRAKQALYNYLLNRAGANGVQNSLMQIQDVWYIKSVDEAGNEVLLVAAPDYKGGETYEAFENRMIALADEGKAVKGKKGSVDVGYRFQKQYNRDAHYVYLKVNGVDKAIYINGDPKAADAINGVYGKELGEAEKKVRDAQRVISSLFTNYSLEFTARNYSRDMIYSHINIAIKEPDPAYRKKFRQNWRTNNLGTMLKMLKAYRAGEYETRALTEAEASFVEFMNNGGQTGYTIINSVENHKRDLEREILGLQNGLAHGGVKNTKVVGTALKGIELLNEASELVTRFAAFKTSRDMGRGINRAISDAKEITVNFNTKGAQDGKGWMGMAARYLGWSKFFFNASVQGVQNIKAMADANRLKFCTTVGGVAAFGFMTPIIMSLLAEMFGGDEEEYWNIPEYDRQNNFCFPIPFTKGAYAKVPLPIGFREIYAMGDMVAAMMFDKKFSRDFGQVGIDMANKIASVVLPINPLESTANGLSIWASLSNIALPSGMQFITQNMSNIDWKGAPLQKEYTYNENDPQWMKAFANNPKWMTVLSKWCNENIDINGDYKGWDWSPEKLDNTLSNLGGGIYTLLKKIGRFFSMAWNEENRNLYNVPLAGVVLGSGADVDDKFVTGAFFEMQDYYDERAGYIKRRAEMFGLTLDDVFLKEKGKHHPKMLEIYSNSNFDFMQEWYKGNKELKELDKEVKKLRRDIESRENPSTAILNKLARKEAQFAAERREFVNDMLELD